ncbi:MAG: hypothetical protein P8Z00_14500 [Anaerolineales bacterium]
MTQKQDINQRNRPPDATKRFGTGSGEALSTGLSELDQALGLGGYPRGQICEIYGPPTCGKTSLLLRAIAAAQHAGSICAFIDGDHSLDATQATRNRVNSQELYISEPASCEQALETTLLLANSGALDLIAVDTLSALPMQADLNAKLDSGRQETSPNRSKRYISQAIWRLSKICKNTGTTVLISNQLRHKSNRLYHEGATTTAPLALKMHAAVRLEMEPWMPGQHANDIVPPGIRGEQATNSLRVRIHIIKNKFTPKKGYINLIIMYNHE